ncbi:unnamed protein product [marine sediment metagenome]|uniref:Uncharacterized protein n=1 Tax=marine sediment metagenome TaxID=412755 RepID=X1LMR4_9ZZZZ
MAKRKIIRIKEEKCDGCGWNIAHFWESNEMDSKAAPNKIGD